MGEPDCSDWDGRLPAHLAVRLDPELREALDHPLRREILRSLSGTDEGFTSTELAAQLGSFSLSLVSYHTLVLAGDKVVIPVGEAPPASRSYISYLSRDPEVVEVLKVTQPCDRERLRRAAGPPQPPAEGDR